MTKKAPKPLTPERVARLVKNPGTRSKVPTRLLPQQYRKARALNERLNAPVVPGSSLTNRDVAKQTKQYVTMKYGAGDAAEKQGLASQQTLNTDTGGWYDEYIKSLQQHSANVGTINDKAVQQVGDYGQGVQNATAQTLQGQSDPISQGVNAQAAAVRDARAGSWVGQVTSQGQGQKTYADTIANVVGPGQKLQARAQGARKLTKLEEDARTRTDTKAADAANYRAGIVSGEGKAIQAQAIAEGKSVADIRKKLIEQDTQVKTARIRARTQRENNIRTTQTQAANNVRSNANKGKNGKKVKFTPLPKGSADQIKVFKQAYQGAAAFKKKHPKYGSDAAARDLHSKKAGNSPLLERAAAEAAVDGFIHKKTAAAIRKQLGIRVRDLGYPVK